jgi:hypothetical protein
LVPNFLLCEEEDRTFENFNRYKNRSFSICDESIFGVADGIFDGSLCKDTKMLKERHREVPEILEKRKSSQCGG